MAAISQARIKKYLRDSQNAGTTKAKGQLFEDLVCYIFDKVPGISVARRNVLNPYHSEEIDVSFWNEKRAAGFSFLPNIILVEAKNWSNPAGSQEIAHFAAKLEERGLEFGLFIALNGVSGVGAEITAARDKVRLALGKKIQILVMKRADIEAFKTGLDVVNFIKTKLCELAVSGTQFD